MEVCSWQNRLFQWKNSGSDGGEIRGSQQYLAEKPTESRWVGEIAILSRMYMDVYIYIYTHYSISWIFIIIVESMGHLDKWEKCCHPKRWMVAKSRKPPRGWLTPKQKNGINHLSTGDSDFATIYGRKSQVPLMFMVRNDSTHDCSIILGWFSSVVPSCPCSLQGCLKDLKKVQCHPPIINQSSTNHQGLVYTLW